MQNIPSHEKTIRMLFKAQEKINIIEPINDEYQIQKYTQVETANGYKYATDLSIDDILIVDESEQLHIKDLTETDEYVLIKV